MKARSKTYKTWPFDPDIFGAGIRHQEGYIRPVASAVPSTSHGYLLYTRKMAKTFNVFPASWTWVSTTTLTLRIVLVGLAGAIAGCAASIVSLSGCWPEPVLAILCTVCPLFSPFQSPLNPQQTTIIGAWSLADAICVVIYGAEGIRPGIVALVEFGLLLEIGMWIANAGVLGFFCANDRYRCMTSADKEAHVARMRQVVIGLSAALL